MLCRKLRNIFFITSLKKFPHSRCRVQTQYRIIKRRQRPQNDICDDELNNWYRMTSVVRFKRIFRDLSAFRLWGVCRGGFLVGTIFRRYKEDQLVKDVVRCFRSGFFRPEGSAVFAISFVAAAAFKSDDDRFSGCEDSITDEELKEAATDIDAVDELSLKTLFCSKCDRRLVIDRKMPGITYCCCKDGRPLQCSYDGWIPFMEAEDVIIWRKEYRNRAGVYAYKVYGRYDDIKAEDFAAIQVDGEYRTNWDSAVAGLMIVDKEAYGLKDQCVLHWEVLWPKLFQNRDYVYIRRHKEFDIKNKVLQHKNRLFNNALTTRKERETKVIDIYDETKSVHAKSKRYSQHLHERDRRQREEESSMVNNKVFIILSRSCEHPDVPPNQNVKRVTEYWSHMIVRTLEGPDKPGMEFVLTYFDAPGGLPSTISAWATGRAAPSYLDKMKRAAGYYTTWLNTREKEYDDAVFRETKEIPSMPKELPSAPKEKKHENVKNVLIDKETSIEEPEKVAEEPDKVEKEPEIETGSWWRFFYPLYYFM